jgi:hypothetical protein
MLLGFDLVEGNCNSLLQWGIKVFAGASEIPTPIRVLLELISEHFGPELNSRGLFQTSEAASFCLRSMAALQSVHPNLYEGGDLGRFKVVSIYLVSAA